MVGAGEDDIAASTDAFALLDELVRMRIGRRLTTVIDTLGLDPERRRAWLVAGARQHGLPCVAVAFDTPAAECRARNRARAKRIPADVLAASSCAPGRRTRDAAGRRGVRRGAHAAAGAGRARRRSSRRRRPRGGSTSSRPGCGSACTWATFDFPAARPATADAAARDRRRRPRRAGFDAIYVMDHFRQIPQVGRAWDDFLESYTTLAYLAACTERVRLGTLVTGITYRNVAHLGKIVATLDVLSGGRAVCGLGLAWFEAEHAAYGWEFPPVADRYALLEDALQLLPLLWGPGSPAVPGPGARRAGGDLLPAAAAGARADHRRRRRRAAHAAARRAVRRRGQRVRRRGDGAAQGGGAARALRAGRPGPRRGRAHPPVHRAGRDRRRACPRAGRPAAPAPPGPGPYAAAVNAGTVADHVGRFRELAEAGVSEVMVRLPDLTDAEPLDRMAKVIAAFR